jgi:hypothetical protein|tara:strand:+ start:191 stop:379 length:189 start_codon:yes stop_codon:yes gene_type:complete
LSWTIKSIYSAKVKATKPILNILLLSGSFSNGRVQMEYSPNNPFEGLRLGQKSITAAEKQMV